MALRWFDLQQCEPQPELKPLKVKETELGLEIRAFNNRLTLDGAVYNKNTVDEILNVNVSNTSGYSSTKVNLGKLRNQGVELLLNVTIVKTKEFSWETGVNGSTMSARCWPWRTGRLVSTWHRRIFRHRIS